MMATSKPSVAAPVKAEPRARGFLLDAFAAGVGAAQPARLIATSLLPRPSPGRMVVVGAGKAAIGMARAVTGALEVRGDGRGPEGLIIAPHAVDQPDPIAGIEVHRGRHPIPDESSIDATVALMALVGGLGERDTLIALWSGGGSALLCEPQGVSLAEKQEVLAALLRVGAGISEINLVRRHLSAVKGGQFVKRAGAGAIHALVLSDVVGDDLAAVASGPTVPDPTTFAEALSVLDRYRVPAPGVRDALRRGARGEMAETPKPGDRIFRRVRTRLIGGGRDAVNGALESLRDAGLRPFVADGRVSGPALAAAERDAIRVRGLESGDVFVTNGECTVEVRGQGRGGRNLEYLLALALELDGEPGVWALAADTDGIDGTSDAAGAVIGPDTIERAAALGIDGAAYLSDNDAHGFFEALGDLVRTGPTGTNVNDLHIVLRMP